MINLLSTFASIMLESKEGWMPDHISQVNAIILGIFSIVENKVFYNDL